jgi:hypothetical protein
MEVIIRQELIDLKCPISDEICAIFITFIQNYFGEMYVKKLRKALPTFCPKSLEKKYLDYLVVFYIFRLHEVPKDLVGISFDEISKLLWENPIRKSLKELSQTIVEKIYQIMIFLKISEMYYGNLGEISNICRVLITFVSRKLCTTQTGGKVNGVIVWIRDIFRIIFNKPKSTRSICNFAGKKRSREIDDVVTGLLSLCEKKENSRVIFSQETEIDEKKEDYHVIFSEDQEGNSSIKLW